MGLLLSVAKGLGLWSRMNSDPGKGWCSLKYCRPSKSLQSAGNVYSHFTNTVSLESNRLFSSRIYHAWESNHATTSGYAWTPHSFWLLPCSPPSALPAQHCSGGALYHPAQHWRGLISSSPLFVTCLQPALSLVSQMYGWFPVENLFITWKNEKSWTICFHDRPTNLWRLLPYWATPSIHY